MSDETSGGHPSGDTPPVKKTVTLQSLITDMVNPVPFQTDALGEIQVREMTMTMQTALVQRLKALDLSDDLAVARVFMGCTSTRPKQEDGKTAPGYKPLPEEDAARLTDQDVQRFAPFFFEKISHEDIGDKDPVAALAEHAREENTKAIESAKKWAEEMSNLFKGSSVMANWPDLRKMLGPSARLAEVMESVQKSLSPLTDANRAIQDALRPLKGIDLDKLGAAPRFGPVEPEFTTPRLDFKRFEFDPEKTPAGRAAASAKALEEIAQQIAGDVGGMVKQVGAMTDLLGKVSAHTEEHKKAAEQQVKTAEQHVKTAEQQVKAAEQQVKAAEQQAEAADRHAKRAGRLAVLAIFVAVVLPLMQMVAEHPGRSLQAEREGRMVELMSEQNQAIRESIEQAEQSRRELADQIEAQRRQVEGDRARIEAIERRQEDAAKASQEAAK